MPRDLDLAGVDLELDGPRTLVRQQGDPLERAHQPLAVELDALVVALRSSGRPRSFGMQELEFDELPDDQRPDDPY